MAIAETSEKKTPVAKKSAAKKSVAVQDSAAWVTYLHDLCPAPGSNKLKTCVGRGEGSKSKTSGCGIKSTKARYQVSARFEGGQVPSHMRLPKLRGFKNPFYVKYQVVNLDHLSETFPEGGTLTAADLVAKGLVCKGELAKVLGSGEVGAKFDLIVDVRSQSARTKVEVKGGSLTVR